MIAFVDDTKQFNNQFILTSEIIDNITYDEKQWSSLLTTSVGVVNFKKYHHIVMQCSSNKHGLMYMTEPDIPGFIIEENNIQCTIRRLSVHDK